MASRGIVVVAQPRFRVDGSIIHSSSLPIERLRRLAIYWDKICVPELRLLLELTRSEYSIRADSADHPDWQYLKDKGILVESSMLNYKTNARHFEPAEVINGHIYASFWSAKYLNDQSSEILWSSGQFGREFTWRSTDEPDRNVVELALVGCLPVPAPDVSIRKIVKFKQNRESELLRFRLAFDDLISKIVNGKDAKQDYIRAKEQIRLSLADLHRVLDETMIQKTASSLRVLLDVKESPLLKGIFSVLGAAGAKILDVSPEMGAVAGFGLSMLLSVCSKKVPKIDTISGKPRDFAYLYEIEKL
jgi:hypothetical protein